MLPKSNAIAAFGKNASIARLKVLALSQTIALSFARAKAGVRYNSTEVHHIVAQRSPKAQTARYILQNLCNISVQSSINLIPLKKGLHRRLHTNEYFDLVNITVSGGWNSKGKSGVLGALLVLRQILNSFNQIAPY